MRCLSNTGSSTQLTARAAEPFEDDPDAKYEALSDGASTSSGESMGIQIPQAFLSTSMSSSSLDVSTTSSSSSSSNPHVRRNSSSSSSKKSKKSEMLLPNLKHQTFSPRSDQNDVDLRRLVAEAKHPNPKAAARAVAAATSSNAAFGGHKRRSSKSRSKTRRNSSSRPDSSPAPSPEKGPVDADTGEAWSSSGSDDGSHCSESDDSTGSENSHGRTTFAANLGPRSQRLPPPVAGDQEMQDSSDHVAWEDQVNDGNDPAEQAPSVSASPTTRVSGFLHWMSDLLVPTPDANNSQVNESIDNTTDQSLASKEQYSAVSYCSEKTHRISNLSPSKRSQVRQDIESGSGGGQHEWSGSWDYRKLFAKRSTVAIVILCVVLFVAVVTTITAALYSPRQNGATNGFVGGGSTRPRPPPFVFTAAPSAALTGSPTGVPPTLPPTTNTSTGSSSNTILGPSSNPSLRPTSSPSPGRPASSPTSDPTRDPTVSPTNEPTKMPTATPTFPMPTTSPSESHAPTPLPTTAFLEADIQSLGEVLYGSAPGERFGYVIAASADGNIVAVGAPLATVGGNIEAGIVQVYEFRGVGWVTRGPALYGRNEEDQFGSAIAISSNGQVLVVSEPTYHGRNGDRSGNVRAFTFSPMNRYEPMGQELPGEAATDHFGVALTLSGDGLRLAAGAPYHDNGGDTRNVSGNVRAFRYNQNLSEWEPLGNSLEGSNHLDWFGWGLDMSSDGSVLAVGAPRNLQHGGYVRCYQLNEDATQWELLGGNDIQNTIQPLRYDDSFGHSVSLSNSVRNNVKYHRLAVGSPGKNAGERNSGVVSVYEFRVDDLAPNGRWIMLGLPLHAVAPGEGHQYGYSVDLNDDVLAVGIPGSDSRKGQVSLYQYSNPTTGAQDWQLHPTIDPTVLQGEASGEFGFNVRLTSSVSATVEEDDVEALAAKGTLTLAVGSPVTGGSAPGSVHIFKVTN